MNFSENKEMLTALGTIVTMTSSYYRSKHGGTLYSWSDGIDRNNSMSEDDKVYPLDNLEYYQIYQDRVRILSLNTMYIEEDKKFNYTGKGYTLKTLIKDYLLLTVDISNDEYLKNKVLYNIGKVNARYFVVKLNSKELKTFNDICLNGIDYFSSHKIIDIESHSGKIKQ